MGSQMSHLHRKFEVTQFVKLQDPEVLVGIPVMMPFHVHLLRIEINILQRCGQVELVVLIQGRV